MHNHFRRACVAGLSSALALSGLAAVADDGFATQVTRGRCTETYSAQGELRAKHSVNIQAPEVEERYLTIKSVAEDGTRVKKGDVLLTLDDSLYQLAQEVARQDLELKKAELERTQFELGEEKATLELEVERKRIAVGKAQAEVVPDSTLVSEVDLKKARLSVKLAQVELDQALKTRSEFTQKYEVKMKVKRLQVEGAARELEKVKKKIGVTIVRAPTDGVVYKPFVQLNNEKGRVDRNRVVRPGDKLLELPSFDSFRAVLHVPAAEVAILKVDDRALVSLSIAPDRAYKARVARIDAYPMTRNERLGRSDPEGHIKEFEVWVDLDESDPTMRPGLTVTAVATTVLATDAIRLPRAALQLDAAGSAWVQVRTPAGLSRRSVTLGRVGLIHAAVTRGLEAGDRVELAPGP